MARIYFQIIWSIEIGMNITTKGGIIVSTSTHLKITDADLLPQDAISAQSDHVALTMGALSIALLVGVSFILSILHSFFA